VGGLDGDVDDDVDVDVDDDGVSLCLLCRSTLGTL
jgi:hypothetical protein